MVWGLWLVGWFGLVLHFWGVWFGFLLGLFGWFGVFLRVFGGVCFLFACWFLFWFLIYAHCLFGYEKSKLSLGLSFSHTHTPSPLFFILHSCISEHREEPWALSDNPPGVGSLATIGSSPPALCILQSKAQGQISQPTAAQLPTISNLLFLEIHVHLGGDPVHFFPGLGSLEHEAGLNTCWRCHGKSRNPQQLLPTFCCSPPGEEATVSIQSMICGDEQKGNESIWRWVHPFGSQQWKGWLVLVASFIEVYVGLLKKR